MDNNKEVQSNNGSTLPEAPASASMKIKSPNGFEYIFTMRDESSKNLLFKMKTMEEHFMNNGFLPVAQNAPRGGSNFPKKETSAQATPTNTMCSTCGKEATEKRGTSRNGKSYHAIFCSTEDRSHTEWLTN